MSTYGCKNCGRKWEARTSTGVSTACPKCRSPKIQMIKKSEPNYSNCLRCKHSWIPRVKEPKICPRCKSPLWNVPPKIKTNTGIGASI